MTIEQLRKLHQAQPFRPFNIHLADGTVYNVSHREFLSQTPSGRTIIVTHPDDTASFIDLLLVTELKVNGTAAPGRSVRNIRTMPKLTIDGREIELPDGLRINAIEAAKRRASKSRTTATMRDSPSWAVAACA